MAFVSRLLPDNPVLTRELRARMRGARAHWMLFGYIGFLSIVLLFRYWQWWAGVETYGGGSRSPALGGEFFSALVMTQAGLAAFLTPAITSGSLTLEREQRTMNLLAVTPIPRRAIISGKLLAAFAFTSLLILSSLPLVSLCFLLGGIDGGQVLSAYLELMAGSFLTAALGLMWSSLAHTTTKAVMFTYLTLCLVAIAVWATQNAGARGEPSAEPTPARAHVTFLFSNHIFGIQAFDGAAFCLLCAVCGVAMATVARVRLSSEP